MIYHKNQPHDYHRKEFDHAPQLVPQQKLVFERTSRARYKEIPCTAEGRSVASCNFNNKGAGARVITPMTLPNPMTDPWKNGIFNTYIYQRFRAKCR